MDNSEKDQAFIVWNNVILEEFLKLPNYVEADGYRDWQDRVLPDKIESKYYIPGRTGAQAMEAFWRDINEGKMPEMLNEFIVPNPLGLIHSSSTLAKHFFVSGKIFTVK